MKTRTYRSVGLAHRKDGELACKRIRDAADQAGHHKQRLMPSTRHIIQHERVHVIAGHDELRVWDAELPADVLDEVDGVRVPVTPAVPRLLTHRTTHVTLCTERGYSSGHARR